MLSKTFKKTGLTALWMLGTTFCLGGCLPIQTTQTGAIEADQVVVTSVCRAWLPISYSSRDTEQTQLEVRANNAAQSAYCRPAR